MNDHYSGSHLDLDKHPNRCLFQFFTPWPCMAAATWQSGQWRVCDEHHRDETERFVPLTEKQRRAVEDVL